MAIKTQYGRITRPKGTYLSNPSTAADGSLGGPSGMNPAPGWTGNLGYGPVSGNGMFWTPQNQAPTVPSGQWYSPIVNAFNQLNKNMENANQAIKDTKIPTVKLPGFLGSVQNATAPLMNGTMSPQNSYVSPFVKGANDQASQEQYGAMPSPNDYGAVIPMNIANQMGAKDGMTATQVAQQMMSAGYTQKWVQDLGQVWVKGSAPTGGSQAFGGGTNGRPDWVDGASLAPGESVTDANGNRFVGGTPAPDGTAQYAINIANTAAAKDTKGKYKWVSDVKKDSNGNWVRVNRQVLRKVYTRSHMKKKAAQAEEQAKQAEAQQPTQQANAYEYNQLVNFRANYG